MDSKINKPSRTCLLSGKRHKNKKELLQAFQKNKASRTYLLSGRGHDNKGIAASILTHQASRRYLMRRKENGNTEIAAGIPNI